MADNTEQLRALLEEIKSKTAATLPRKNGFYTVYEPNPAHAAIDAALALLPPSGEQPQGGEGEKAKNDAYLLDKMVDAYANDQLENQHDNIGCCKESMAAALKAIRPYLQPTPPPSSVTEPAPDAYAVEREIERQLENGCIMVTEEGSDYAYPHVKVEDAMDIIRPYLPSLRPATPTVMRADTLIHRIVEICDDNQGYAHTSVALRELLLPYLKPATPTEPDASLPEAYYTSAADRAEYYRQKWIAERNKNKAATPTEGVKDDE